MKKTLRNLALCLVLGVSALSLNASAGISASTATDTEKDISDTGALKLSFAGDSFGDFSNFYDTHAAELKQGGIVYFTLEDVKKLANLPAAYDKDSLYAAVTNSLSATDDFYTGTDKDANNTTIRKRILGGVLGNILGQINSSGLDDSNAFKNAAFAVNVPDDVSTVIPVGKSKALSGGLSVPAFHEKKSKIELEKLLVKFNLDSIEKDAKLSDDDEVVKKILPSEVPSADIKAQIIKISPYDKSEFEKSIDAFLAQKHSQYKNELDALKISVKDKSSKAGTKAGATKKSLDKKEQEFIKTYGDATAPKNAAQIANLFVSELPEYLLKNSGPSTGDFDKAYHSVFGNNLHPSLSKKSPLDLWTHLLNDLKDLQKSGDEVLTALMSKSIISDKDLDQNDIVDEIKAYGGHPTGATTIDLDAVAKEFYGTHGLKPDDLKNSFKKHTKHTK